MPPLSTITRFILTRFVKVATPILVIIVISYIQHNEPIKSKKEESRDCSKLCPYRSTLFKTHIQFDSNHITPHYPEFVCQVNFRNLADWVYGWPDHSEERVEVTTTSGKEIAPCLANGSIIYVSIWSIGAFFSLVYPNLINNFVLITGEGDMSSPNLELLERADSKIIHWFGQNGIINASVSKKFTHIPIGIQCDEMAAAIRSLYQQQETTQTLPTEHNDLDEPSSYIQLTDMTRRVLTEKDNIPKSNLLLMNFDIHSDGKKFRQRIWHEMCLKKDRVRLATCKIKSSDGSKSSLWHVYRQNRQYFFWLSPRGNGIDCHRTWEALYLDAIPIVWNSSLNSLYENLPVLVVQNYTDLNETFLREKLHEISSKKFNKTQLAYLFEKLRIAYWRRLILMFNRIQSLNLYSISSNEMMQRILIELPHLHNLTRLSIINNVVHFNSQEILLMVNIIWSLPKLVYCYLDTKRCCASQVSSVSLKYVCVRCCSCDFDEFNHMLENTPNLRHLSMYFLYVNKANYDLSRSIPMLTKLNIGFQRVHLNFIMSFLSKLPALTHLTIRTNGMGIDGTTWEYIIKNYLLQLKELQFYMNFSYRGTINSLLNTFQSSFWIDERRWPVQCDWKLDHENVRLYTLPYRFHNFNFAYPTQSETTNSIHGNDMYYSYDVVHRLTYKNRFFPNATLSHIRFTQIHSLTISFPLVNEFWSIVPTFDELVSLEILLYYHHEFYRDQLQTLLDQAPRLRTLCIHEQPFSTLQRPPIFLKSTSIRELRLQFSYRAYNIEECIELSRSSLGTQCTTLVINVESRMCVHELITRMPNLLSLVVQFSNETNTMKTSLINEDLIEWLRNRISHPSTIYKYI